MRAYCGLMPRHSTIKSLLLLLLARRLGCWAVLRVNAGYFSLLRVIDRARPVGRFNQPVLRRRAVTTAYEPR